MGDETKEAFAAHIARYGPLHKALAAGPAAARNADPVSSHLAASDAEKNAPKDRVWALQAVHARPGLTARELAHYLTIMEPGYLTTYPKAYEKLHRRLPELRKAGLVRAEVSEPKCGMSGRLMQRWFFVRQP